MSTAFDDRRRLRLLEQLAADRHGDGIKPVEHYLALFPGHDEEVTAEWRSWTAPADSDDVRFGPYRLERVLGRGGQGVVYQAVDTRLDRRVALKVLTTLTLAGPQAGPPRLLAREVEALTRLDNRRIAGIFEAGIEDGRAFLAMRLVKGPSLREQLSRWQQGPGPSLADRMQLGLEIVRAVAAAHAQGVLHRDIKPSNVLLEQTEGSLHPVLIDFGLARAVDSNTGYGETMTGDQIGTPSYMSPERLLGEGHDEPHADIWALGVLLYELATYRVPFTGKTFETVARRIERDEVPRLDLPSYNRRRDLEALLGCALEKSRARRYATATALAEDLGLLLSGKPIGVRPVGLVARSARWLRRHPAYATILILLVSIAGLSSWTAWQLDQSRTTERDARHRATANLARSEADRGHLLLESKAVERYQSARKHLERAAAAGAVVDATLRSDVVRSLTGTDMVERATIAVGGLSTVKVDPTASIVAAQSISPESRLLELSMYKLEGDRARSLDAIDVDPAASLLAVHPAALVVANRETLQILPLANANDHALIPELTIPARSERTSAPRGSTAFGFAAFDASGSYLVAAEGRTWTLYTTAKGAAVATGTAATDLGGTLNFSPDGRWFVARQDASTIFVLDRARHPLKLTLDHPIVQAMPANGDRATVLVLQAKPAGLELGVWRAPSVAAQGKANQPRYRRLARLVGAGSPPPRLATHGPWVAAATEQELVVANVNNGWVPVRCSLGQAQGLESLTFCGEGVALRNLELLVHQRGMPLRRFGFARAIDWLQDATGSASPFATKRRRLQFRKVPTKSSPGLPGLAESTVGFDADDELELGVTGLMFLPYGSKTSNSVVESGSRTVGAAMVSVLREQTIESYAHVWQRGNAKPVYCVQGSFVRGPGAVALTEDGKHLAVMRTDGRLQLHDIAAERLLLDLPIAVTDIDRSARDMLFLDGHLWLRTNTNVWRLDLVRLQRDLELRNLGFGAH